MASRIIESPIDYPCVQFYQLWLERGQHSQMHRWFRQTVSSMRSTSGTRVQPA